MGLSQLEHLTTVEILVPCMDFSLGPYMIVAIVIKAQA